MTAQRELVAAALVAGRSMKLSQVMVRKHVGWNLLINMWVEIRFYGRVIRTGFVDDAMPDSSAIWIAANANDPRQMFEASEGLEVWVMP